MDKRKAREQRKREEERKKRKEQHAKNRSDNSVIRPEEIIPLQISGDVNLYDYLKDRIRSGEALEMDIQLGASITKYMANVDQTLDHFKTTLEKRSGAGDALIRFGLLQSQQPEGKHFRIDGNDPALNWLADLWEYFNNLEL
jgi:hypothetical protein